MNGLRWCILFFCFKYSDWYQHFHNMLIPLFKKKNTPKAFCIGDVRTGTSSLYKALRILGYRSVRLLEWGPLLRNEWEQYLKKLEELQKLKWQPYIKKLKKYNYDAFIDFPMGYGDLYQQIDKAIPNSKFILTVRDKQSFAKSYQNYFRGSPWEITNTQELKQRVQEFEERNKQVIKYFKDMPSQLLVMNILEGDNWKILCNFLNKPIPKKTFPYRNIGRYKK